MLLKDKVAIVTGAQQGIGKAIATEFAKHGATVVLCDLSQEKLLEAEECLKQNGQNAMALTVDVTNKKAVGAVAAAVAKKFGRIDILVNNAGILKHSLIVDMEEKDWDMVFAVNMKGTFLFTQAVAPFMIKQRSGKIINLSSCSGKKPDKKGAAYNSSKSAIIGFTRVAALELGEYGINCNGICPGATDTEMIRKTFMTSPEIEREWIEKTAIKRLGKPEDMANVAVFLASELSSHVTGESIIVSGGELMGQ
jgi:NAD(P)-dependent dehydrogenase (short-subunit alcohol dehydrogenase family)